MTRLFIGNLPYKIDEKTLVAALEAIGIDAQKPFIVRDKATQQPRGFGFVEVEDHAADSAIKNGDGYEVLGRSIRVSRAHERPTAPRNAAAAPRAPRPAPAVHVAEVPPEASRREREQKKSRRRDTGDDVWR